MHTEPFVSPCKQLKFHFMLGILTTKLYFIIYSHVGLQVSIYFRCD